MVSDSFHGSFFNLFQDFSYEDPIFATASLFRRDLRNYKVDLSIGLYRNEQQLTTVMAAVKEAEAMYLMNEESKVYLPILGDSQFIEKVGELVFGKDLWRSEGKRILGVQTPGATSALRMAGECVKKKSISKVAISSPTWVNHPHIFGECGLESVPYPYYDLNGLHFERSCHFFEALPEGSMVLLQPSCHNPTGLSWRHDQWKVIRSLLGRGKLLPLFDFSYQGLGEGLESDAEVIRSWLKSGMEMLVAISHAKNFGLYGERSGALFVVAADPNPLKGIRSQLEWVIRACYSNPPRHGSSLVHLILSTPDLKNKWEQELAGMRERVKYLRRRLAEELQLRLHTESAHRSILHLKNGEGLFWMSGLSARQIELLRIDYGIYLSQDGRLNVAGLTDICIPYIVESFCKVLV